jgi:DNA polymerase-3 subunit alpha
MKIDVLGPDINESNIKFAVNAKGQVRFGLVCTQRCRRRTSRRNRQRTQRKWHFEDVFDMMRRLNLRSVNKKCMDSLVLGGALDSFGEINRAQYFELTGDRNETFIESF